MTPIFTPRATYPRSPNRRPITAKQSAEFTAAVTARLEGHLRPAHLPEEWLVLTSCGWLRVCLPTTMTGDLFTVFTHFVGSKADLARASVTLTGQRVNSYSGKWNVHCTDAQEAYNTFCRQLAKVEARPAPIAMADLTFEEYAAPGGPGCAQRVAHYQDHLKALRLRAEAGDLLAKRDYATNSKPDSIINRVIWNYLRGEVDDFMRFDMHRDWQEHTARANRTTSTVS